MYIVTVIPLKKGLEKEHLTYFSAMIIPLGSIVSIPVRLKTIDALVVAIDDAQSMKSSIKDAHFQLKKITNVKGLSPFTTEFFTACVRMKDYTVSTTGTIIRALLPTVLLENISSLAHRAEKPTPDIRPLHEKLIFQALTPDRIAFYRTLIREAFARKESVYICVPTYYDIETFTDALTKGIEKYVFSFHTDMPKKKLLLSYNRAIEESHPILIIATGTFLLLPRPDIRTIIVEHESSDAYKQFGRPYLDIRSFAEVYASITKTKLIFADTLLGPETLYRHDEGELGEIASPLFRLPQTQRQLVVDMKREVDEKGVKKFKVLSQTTESMIAYALEHNEKVFLYSVRKGLAGVTVCHDCGSTVLCPRCATPVVLYGTKQRTATKSEESRIFMCNKCGYKETTEIRCSTCDSWNLTPLGIGTDRVHEEVASVFPNATIIQIDKEATPTDTEARKAISTFYKTPQSILIGTDMAFSYIKGQINHSALVSLDGLLSIPSFNITQKILHTIEKLHSITDKTLVIQTRIPDNQILAQILSGNVLPLYREDLRERKQFGYPPFKRLIKISFTGTASETEKARNYIDHALADYEPQVFSAFRTKVKGTYITNTVLKVDSTLWPLPTKDTLHPDQSLATILESLPPSFAINVDPEDLL